MYRFGGICWWKKSGVHQLIWFNLPIIYRGSYILGGAGFLPSTVLLKFVTGFLGWHLLINAGFPSAWRYRTEGFTFCSKEGWKTVSSHSDLSLMYNQWERHKWSNYPIQIKCTHERTDEWMKATMKEGRKERPVQEGRQGGKEERRKEGKKERPKSEIDITWIYPPGNESVSPSEKGMIFQLSLLVRYVCIDKHRLIYRWIGSKVYMWYIMKLVPYTVFHVARKNVRFRWHVINMDVS